PLRRVPTPPPVPSPTLFRSAAVVLGRGEQQQRSQVQVTRDTSARFFAHEPIEAARQRALARFRVTLDQQLSDSQSQHAVAQKFQDRKSTRLNSSHVKISYAV